MSKGEDKVKFTKKFIALIAVIAVTLGLFQILMMQAQLHLKMVIA